MVQERVGQAVLIVAAGIAVASLGGCGAMGVKPPTLALACGPLSHGEVPRNAAAASRIARHDLSDLMGEPSVLRQEPFVVKFDDYRWVIRGTLPPGEEHGRYLVVLDAKTGCATYVGADDIGEP